MFNLGASPPKGSKMAWWFLSAEASSLLAQARLGGKFGGMPGKAPYWFVVEEGDETVGVRGRHYIENAMAEFERVSPGIVENFFNV